MQGSTETTTKRGRGRPAKESRSTAVKVFFTPQQAEKIASRAAAAGLPVSTFIRQQVLKLRG
jgi:hypothetical protein